LAKTKQLDVHVVVERGDYLFL